jgi:hypothetical protein
LIGVVLVAIAAAVIIGLVVTSGGSSSTRPEVTAKQVRQLALNDSKSTVVAKLGGEGEHGRYRETTGNFTEYPDCWYYSPVGPEKSGTMKDFVACFEAGELITYVGPFRY